MVDNEKLETIFQRYRDRNFIFVEPGGNWGDHLIYRGAERLARQTRINFVSLTFTQFMQEHPEPNVAIYLHGGGGFNTIYKGDDLDALTHALRHYSGPIIQGPQTTEDSVQYLRLLASRIEGAGNPNFYLFTREKVTWQNLRRVIADDQVKIRLDHDTAFHLTREDLLGAGSFRPRYKLLALREDEEQPAHDLPFRHFRGLRLDPARYATSLDHWVRIHAHSHSIITNRTHSAIVSAILGIPATLLPGSYHKNHSIWEYSLRDRGVNWQDWPAQGPQAPSGPLVQALSQIRHSHKLRQLRLSLMPLRGIPRR